VSQLIHALEGVWEYQVEAKRKSAHRTYRNRFGRAGPRPGARGNL